MIIDAHFHLPCGDGLVSLQDKRERLLSTLELAGVGYGIVIADSEAESVIGTPAECVELFLGDRNIFVVGGISPLIDFPRRLEQMEEYLSQGRIVGLKLYPGHEAFYMDHPDLDRVFDLCEKYDAPLAVHTGWSNARYNNPPYFVKIAENRPRLKIIICHMYWPDIDYCYRITRHLHVVQHREPPEDGRGNVPFRCDKAGAAL